MPSIQVVVTHEVGLHARPAAEFVKLASAYPSSIQVRNVTSNGKFVDAKSILMVLTLGVNQGHKIEIEASGDQSGEALEALQELIESNFGESKIG